MEVKLMYWNDVLILINIDSLLEFFKWIESRDIG